jgi:hypothetical protein
MTQDYQPGLKSKVVRFQLMDSPLLQYRHNVTSQSGEDGIIAHIMGVLKPAERYCVEFGAWDGKHFSNCNSLITRDGWRGMMIEANAEKFKELQETFATFPGVTNVNRLVDFEGPNRQDNILTEHGAPKDLALLSIDVDGNDYHIWDSLKEHTPEVVVIEINPTMPNDVFFIQQRSFEINHGSSLLAMIILGKEKGYELAAATTFNAFFVRADRFGLLGIKDNAIHKMYDPPQNGRIFQGFDGTIHVVGMDRLVWRNIALSAENFQVLAKEDRVYGDAQRK